jgi:hypothetical protein
MREDVVRPRVEDYDADAGVADMLDDYGEARFAEGQTEEEPEATAKAFYDMLAASHKPLHGHTTVSQLDAIGCIMVREVHGPEYDPTTDDLDTEIVMRVGGGKKKRRYWIADGTIDSSSFSDSSKEHECEPSHTTSAGHFTPSDTGTPGYSFFIRRSLIITYLFFALL